MPLLSIAVFVVYYSYQAWVESKSDASTLASQMTLNTLMRRVRSAWVHKNYNGGSSAVNVSTQTRRISSFVHISHSQTFRDYIRSSVFFGSSAFVVSFGLLTIMLGSFPSCFEGADESGLECSSTVQLLLLKLVLLAVMFFVMAFFFAQAVRLATHAEVLISCPPVAEVRGHRLTVSREFTTAVFDKAHLNWALGMRVFYFAGPLAANVVSAYAMLAVTLVFVFVLEQLEHVHVKHEHTLHGGGLRWERLAAPNSEHSVLSKRRTQSEEATSGGGIVTPDAPEANTEGSAQTAASPHSAAGAAAPERPPSTTEGGTRGDADEVMSSGDNPPSQALRDRAGRV